jgi:hypothetical protein
MHPDPGFPTDNDAALRAATPHHSKMFPGQSRTPPLRVGFADIQKATECRKHFLPFLHKKPRAGLLFPLFEPFFFYVRPLTRYFFHSFFMV